MLTKGKFHIYDRPAVSDVSDVFTSLTSSLPSPLYQDIRHQLISQISETLHYDFSPLPSRDQLDIDGNGLDGGQGPEVVVTFQNYVTRSGRFIPT